MTPPRTIGRREAAQGSEPQPAPFAVAAGSRPGGLGANPRSAFTLLEILISLALMGMLMVALNTVIFSMGELWGRNTEAHLFDAHVNAVTRFLQNQINEATFPPAARPFSTPVAPLPITPLTGMQDNLISYELPAGSRFLSWAGETLPEVVCYLQVRPNDGLYLLWHSRLEMDFLTRPPRETRITPYATAIAYDYWDTTQKHWTTQTTVQLDSGGTPMVPSRVEITFAYGKLPPRTVALVIPNAIQGPPNY